jgi:hypothetical protein
MPKREIISCQKMPLAVYREVESHLKQVLGVRVEILSQSSQDFAYSQSQIEGLLIDYPQNSSHKSPLDTFGDRQKQVEAILAYYAKRHGQWERIEEKVIEEKV